VQEPVAWGVFEGGNLHDMFFSKEEAEHMALLKGSHAEVRPLYTTPPAQPAPVQELVAQAWDEGYRAGIDDERTSEDSIGIAGFDAKVEPARNNPYRTTPPAARRPWVGLTDEEIFSVLDNLQRKYNGPPTEDSRVVFALAIEAKLKERNQ
jgi:hypothetical protein